MKAMVAALTPKIEAGAIKNNLNSIKASVFKAYEKGACVAVIGSNPFVGEVFCFNGGLNAQIDAINEQCIKNLAAECKITCVFRVLNRAVIIENGLVHFTNSLTLKNGLRIFVCSLDEIEKANAIDADLVLISEAYPAFMDGRARIESKIGDLSKRFRGAIGLASNGNGNSTHGFVRAQDKIIAHGGKLISAFEETDSLVYNLGEVSVLKEPLSFENIPSWIPDDVDGVFDIVSRAISARMAAARAEKLILGLSGGLDSSAALLFAHKLGADKVIGVFMNTIESGERTKNNAKRLANALGVATRNIDIDIGYRLKRIGHNALDVVYENAQSRERSSILLDIGNKEGGLVLGTSDLTELALGFCTYGGDNIAHFNPNSGLSKLALRKVCAHFAFKTGEKELISIVDDILSTPYSPELKPNQSSEQILGPYKLYEYFLLRLFAYHERGQEIILNAKNEFKNEPFFGEIDSLYNRFASRFFAHRFKAAFSCDGVALTPFDPVFCSFNCDINPQIIL